MTSIHLPRDSFFSSKRNKSRSSANDQINLNTVSSSKPQQQDDDQSAANIRSREEDEGVDQSAVSTSNASIDSTPVEGGIWGWIVVAGSTTIMFVVLGMSYSFGVMQSELLKRNFASSSTLGWVSSTTVVFFPILAIPITALIKFSSNKSCALVGALCTGLGYFATSFTFDKPVVFLFLAQSLFGLGYAFCCWSCNSLAGQYFVRKRGLAMGIVYAGAGVGGALFSIILSRLIAKVGLEVAIRIYGGLALALLIPASFTLRSNKQIVIASFRWSLLRDFNFNLLILSAALVTFSLFVPAFFLPSYAVAAGRSAETGAWLLAGYNLASAVGRILFGLLADGRIGPLTSLCIAMLLMATSILCIWIFSGAFLAPLIVFLLINGAASGALFSLQPPVLSSLYSVQETAVTMAMVTMSRAFGSALGPPIAGYLLDVSKAKAVGQTIPVGDTKAYILPLGVMGGISMIAALLLTLLRWRLAGLDLKKRI